MKGAIFSKLFRSIDSIIPEPIRPSRITSKTFFIHTSCPAITMDTPYPLNTKDLGLKTNVSFKGVKKALGEVWELKVVDQVIVRWRDFMFGYTHTTEVTVDNWAEIVKSLYMEGGNDTLEINGREVSEGPKKEGDTSA